MSLCSFFFCGRCSNWAEQRRKDSSSWRIFSLKELRSATNNFNYDNKLGEGGFGSVYWGQLWDGSQIAVKRLKVWSNSEQEKFAAEVEKLGAVRHKNLLSFRGYCAEGQEHLIVYDYMPNLSLHSHLHGYHSDECFLDWGRRMSIVIGTSEGITHLHQQTTPPIIHQDIKASNVLLDSDFQARVADFGFVKIIPGGLNLQTTTAKSTLGYLTPEYIKSDWALPLVREEKYEEIADPKLNGDYIQEELKSVVIIALICAEKNPERRPKMPEVTGLLKGVSKEKLSSLENEVCRLEPTVSYQGTSTPIEVSEDVAQRETVL
ncbi:PTI1-like tyrosine-protein kinase At3g15890 isoform X2 [Zingiber officinale]|uniref:PTI1-like tyrosine-protein kinase At3g15890 isoform X2 n=1 Tax=Zingiber officinale TaxID=94328 RepID=UPI001C4CDB9C|nr:PTI1-like tyrosine-protein kinase At3g15890 isoform X2 [Zingiber officinale]